MNTNALLLARLSEHMTYEPERPDPERHDGYHYQTVARAYEEWDRTRAAWYLLLGVRLVNAALDGDLDVDA